MSRLKDTSYQGRWPEVITAVVLWFAVGIIIFLCRILSLDPSSFSSWRHSRRSDGISALCTASDQVKISSADAGENPSLSLSERRPHRSPAKRERTQVLEVFKNGNRRIFGANHRSARNTAGQGRGRARIVADAIHPSSRRGRHARTRVPRATPNAR
jgi:hypothetical protein